MKARHPPAANRPASPLIVELFTPEARPQRGMASVIHRNHASLNYHFGFEPIPKAFQYLRPEGQVKRTLGEARLFVRELRISAKQIFEKRSIGFPRKMSIGVPQNAKL
jgi:hypothetical protein